MIPRIRPALLAAISLLACLSIFPNVSAAAGAAAQYITYQAADGSTVYLDDDRRPALYTGNFGDCLGNSAINVTRFDAAYYKDNMTVLFHIQGNSGLTNESIMMYIGVYAYGEPRFDLTFNPCSANINSLCPVNSSVPIEAAGVIPVGQADVLNIPPIALTIPDFEGIAILRLFANSTQSEIGCYSAVLTNGNTFSHPSSVGTILGIFTLVALLASFATAAYGEAVPTMRLHYAHSLSVGVVFAVFQHIFFTGALSMNWPSVLVAWWSNFAWAGGMINSASMQASINHLIGNNVGNTSQVGAAASGSTQETLGGGYDISQIYKRAFQTGIRPMGNHPFLRDIASEIYRRPQDTVLKRDLVQRSFEHTLQKRALANATTGYRWYGHPVGVGLPLPGNYSGFAGTLAQEEIRASNAFMTGFLWLIILVVILVAALMAFKWVLEGLALCKLVKEDCMAFFRKHWLGYSAALALRICYLAFFMIMFLTMFQFTYNSSGGAKAVAAIVFILFIVGIPGVAAYAIMYKRRIDRNHEAGQRSPMERKMLLGKIPWFGAKKTGAEQETGHEMQRHESKSSIKPFWKRASHGSFADGNGHPYSIHDDEDYTMKFGWLAARFRRTRWWFFAIWTFYEFVRAIFYAGASGHPLVQVFGILVIEFLAFVFILWAKPFEGRRLNLLVVYCLGFSKVASVALSAAFDVQFNVQRIPTTVIGVVIIVIQGILTIITLIAIVVGAVSSYMSVSRNREDFRPRKWAGLREKYFNHLDQAVNDMPPEVAPELVREPDEEPKEPYFAMKSVRRLAKIEDEDAEFSSEMRPHDPAASYNNLDDNTPASASMLDGERSGNQTPHRKSRAASLRSIGSNSVPFGARSLRPSWSTADFDRIYTPVDMTRDLPDDDLDDNIPPVPKDDRIRAPSRSVTIPKLPPQPSNDSIRVGGDVSTRDTIGKVPAPTMRPRAGTLGSVRSLGSNSALAAEWGDRLGELAPDPQPSSHRGSRAPPPLTPAQEQDEWKLSPRASHEAR